MMVTMTITPMLDDDNDDDRGVGTKVEVLSRTKRVASLCTRQYGTCCSQPSPPKKTLFGIIKILYCKYHAYRHGVERCKRCNKRYWYARRHHTCESVITKHELRGTAGMCTHVMP